MQLPAAECKKHSPDCKNVVLGWRYFFFPECSSIHADGDLPWIFVNAL